MSLALVQPSEGLSGQVPDFTTVEEYLAAEELSPVKHEYLGGLVYAMAGASGPHNVIASNLAGLLYNRLRGKGCRFFGSDMKLRFSPDGSRFYYPAGMVLCDPREFSQSFSERPSVIFQILSEETRTTDVREKSAAYRSLPSTAAYVLIEQKSAMVTVTRRHPEGWRGKVFSGLAALADLGVRELALPLAELYEDVVFPT